MVRTFYVVSHPSFGFMASPRMDHPYTRCLDEAHLFRVRASAEEWCFANETVHPVVIDPAVTTAFTVC